MSLPGTIARKARKAARFHRQFGIGGLFWETVDRLAGPLVRAAEGAAWRRVQESARSGDAVSILGHRMFLLQSDLGISRELAIYGIHEPLTTRVLGRILAPGMRVVDVGSNIGYFLLLEARIVGPRGFVIGVEPEPANFQVLKRNVEINGYTNVFLINKAVGEYDGVGILHVAHHSNWHSLSAVPWETAAQIQVETVSLDNVLKDQQVHEVDLVRMDIEGYEVHVLSGMQRVLHEIRPKLLVEIHPHLIEPPVLQEYFAKLRAADYEVQLVLDRRWDHPLHGWRLRPERLSITQLARDARVIVERRTITALFCPR